MNATCRALCVRSCLIVLTLSGFLERANAQPPVREMEFGVKPDDFQKNFQKRIDTKFAPVSVSAHYAPRGRTVLAAVWEKRKAGRMMLKLGLTQEAMSKAVSKMAEDGFRLEFLTGLGAGGAERYSAVWELAPGQELAVRYGYPLAELLKKHAEFTRKKYVINSLAAVQISGRIAYTAAWEKDELAVRELHAGISEGVFLRQVRDKPKKGFRLRQACSYVAGRRVLVSCIWEKTSGPPQVIKTRQTSIALQKLHKKMTADGYVPALISGLSINTRDRYLVVWEKPMAKKP